MLTRTLAAYAVIFRSEVRDDSKRRNQAAAARTIGIKRIDAGTAVPKTLAGARLACEPHHTRQMHCGVKQKRHSLNTRADLSSAQMRRAR